MLWREIDATDTNAVMMNYVSKDAASRAAAQQTENGHDIRDEEIVPVARTNGSMTA